MDANEIAQTITTPTPLAEWWLVVVTGMFALLVTISAVTPRVTRSRKAMFGLTVFSTIVHEAGHAAAACITGGGVYVIQVHSPDSGITWTWYYSRLSSVITKVAGYAAPPLTGLAAAGMLSRGHAPMVLALTVAAMALILIVTRDRTTLASVTTVGLVAFAALWWGSVDVQHWVAYTEAWLLLLTEAPGIWAIISNRIHGYHGDIPDDAHSLAQITHIPAVVWIAGWIALMGWTWWQAAPLLWP